MEINILFFGQIADITGQGSLKYPDVKNSDEVIYLLKKIYPQLQSLEFSIAVNKKIVQENTMLNDKDTVAILPPFSGG